MFGGGTRGGRRRTRGRCSARRTGARRSRGSLRNVAPGNALVFIEQGDDRTSAPRRSSRRSRRPSARPAARVASFAAPEGRRARRLAPEPGAERGRHPRGPRRPEELARRVGGFVTEGDVDRQRQGALAVAELEKLALYRPDGADHRRGRAWRWSRRSIPDSTWALLDAVADRNVATRRPRCWTASSRPSPSRSPRPAAPPAAGAADGRGPRRAPGRRRRTSSRLIGGHPFRVEKAREQARRWTVDELDGGARGRAGAGRGRQGGGWVRVATDRQAPAGVRAVGARARRGRRSGRRERRGRPAPSRAG